MKHRDLKKSPDELVLGLADMFSMENKKVVLVVEHDEILRNGMRLILEAMNFQVEEAGQGKEALRMTVAKNYDLIISDFEMPDMDGVQLLAHVKASSNPCCFILLSEFSTALQARQASQLGADEFLNKPFNRVDFTKVVETAMTKNERPDLPTEDYIQVPIQEFITGSMLKVDLFIQLSDNKYLKIANKGGTLAPERVDGYRKKGLHWFYMRKVDFATYVGFNITLAQKAHSVDRIEMTKKIRLTMHVTENLIAQLRRAGLNRQQLEDSSNVVMNAVELIVSRGDTMKLLESMEVVGTLPAHAIAVSIWACLIAKQLGWSGHTTFFKISICALFHDIGNKEIDDPLFQKQRFELTRQEVKIIEAHTQRGRDILQSVPGMPNDAAIVAAQHHELFRGGGYPYGLRLQQIHPLAALIGLADRLCEFLKFNGEDSGILAAYNQIELNQRDYDTEYFKALKEIVRKVKPSQFDEEPNLLRSKTLRQAI